MVSLPAAAEVDAVVAEFIEHQICIGCLTAASGCGAARVRL